MYTTTRLLRNILVSVSKNQRKKSRPNKKWVDMQYLITFARACFSVGKKNNRQERFFVSKSEMLYFRDRSIKNPIILVEFDDQYQCCCSEASVVISIVRSWEVKKRLDHIMVSWELGLRTDFFPAGPAGTLWWTLRENGLLEFLRTLATQRVCSWRAKVWDDFSMQIAIKVWLFSRFDYCTIWLKINHQSISKSSYSLILKQSAHRKANFTDLLEGKYYTVCLHVVWRFAQNSY